MNAKRVSGPRRGPPGLIIAGATEDFGAAHHGSVPFPGSLRPPPTVGGRFRAAVPAAIVLVPFAGLAAAVWLAWGHGLGLADVLLALGFYPVCARHGAGRGQMDISAGLIRIFEHLGWATGVRWPDPGRLAAHRRGSRQDQLRPVPQTAETAAASAARDDLIARRQTTRAYTASCLGNGTPRGSYQRATSRSRWNRLYFPASQQAAGVHPQSRNGQSALQTPAGASAPAENSREGISQL